MNVKELISLLKNYPPDVEVLLGSDMGLGGVEKVEIIVVVDRVSSYFKSGKYVEYATVDDHPSNLRDAVLID